MHLDEGRQCVLRDGADIQLTAAEFRLLRYFMLHPEQILSKSHLAEHLYDGETERDSNVLEVHVNHLRRKFGRNVIETRRGQGYLFGAHTGMRSIQRRLSLGLISVMVVVGLVLAQTSLWLFEVGLQRYLEAGSAQ